MTDSLQDVVADLRKFARGLRHRGGRAREDIHVFADRLSAIAAPVWTDEQCIEFLRIAFRHVNIQGDIEFNDIRMGIKRANALSPGRSGEVNGE